MERQKYAQRHKERYLDWLDNVRCGPYTTLDKLEFAIISAHTPMEAAIQGWGASRNSTTMDDYANALNDNGVLAAFNKAGYVWRMREMLVDDKNCPQADYREYRRTVKLPGLGWSKLSFASCLIDPFNSSIVCLDTHMLDALVPGITEKEKAIAFRKLERYEQIESILIGEAVEVDTPLFAYQWAVWDYVRSTKTGKAAESHSFLWDGKYCRFQLPMFSGMIQ